MAATRSASTPAGTNNLTLATGAVLTGTIDGGGSDSTVNLVGRGALSNTIANFGAGSEVNIEQNADWTATGHWTVATVTNSGTFQAGTLNPDPPLYLNGNFVQTTTGTLQVVVTPTLSTQFLVSGTAQLAGGLKYIFTPGTYAPHTYNFLTASGGITGSFATINYSGAVPPTIANRPCHHQRRRRLQPGAEPGRRRARQPRLVPGDAGG